MFSGWHPRKCRYCQEKNLKCSKLERPRTQKCRNCLGKRECIDANVIVVDIFAHQSASANRIVRAEKRPSPRVVRYTSLTYSPEPSHFVAVNSQRTGRCGLRLSLKSSGSPVPDSVVAGHVRKIVVSLDIGSGNMKAAWKPVYHQEQERALVNDKLRHDCKPVIWPNDQAHCPAQLAHMFVKDGSGRVTMKQLWGDEVDEHLRLGNIVEEDVLKWLKPAIFNEDDSRAEQFHKGQLEFRLSRLKIKAREECVERAQWEYIDARSLYSDLLTHSYRWVTKKITDKIPRVGLVTGASEYNRRPEISIEVALPVPANSSFAQIKQVLQAAERAQLPSPFPVAEPTAAISESLQEEMEAVTDQRVSRKSTVLLLDAGEGSLDAILCSVEPQWGLDPAAVNDCSPEIPNQHLTPPRYALKEEIAGATEWAGGSRANLELQKWLEEVYNEEFEDMLRHPELQRRYHTTPNIIAKLVRSFEHEKKRFTGDWNRYDIRLELFGFPPRPMNNHQGDAIIIGRQVVESFFAPQLEASIRLLSDQIRRFDSRNRVLGQVLKLDRIILVGGANESPYIKRALKEAVNRITPFSAHKIEVVLPQIQSHISTARGSLLLLLDKDFVGERVVRRGYCVKWNKPTNCKRSKRCPVVRDPDDGVRCMEDVSVFLLRIGDRIPHRHVIRKRAGFRMLFVDPERNDTGFDHEKDCYLIEEVFFYSDKVSDDDHWVYDPGNEIHEAGKLLFRLNRNDCREFAEPRVNEHDGKRYYYVEYEVSLEIIGLDCTYKMLIPETGQFQGEGPRGCGRYPIVEEGKMTWKDKAGLCIV